MRNKQTDGGKRLGEKGMRKEQRGGGGGGMNQVSDEARRRRTESRMKRKENYRDGKVTKSRRGRGG